MLDDYNSAISDSFLGSVKYGAEWILNQIVHHPIRSSVNVAIMGISPAIGGTIGGLIGSRVGMKAIPWGSLVSKVLKTGSKLLGASAGFNAGETIFDLMKDDINQDLGLRGERENRFTLNRIVDDALLFGVQDYAFAKLLPHVTKAGKAGVGYIYENAGIKTATNNISNKYNSLIKDNFQKILEDERVANIRNKTSNAVDNARNFLENNEQFTALRNKTSNVVDTIKNALSDITTKVKERGKGIYDNFRKK